MPHMPCPACATRWIGAVAPTTCPACHGQARLTINRQAAYEEGWANWPDRDRIDHGGHNLREEDIIQLGAKIISTGVWLGLARAARATVGQAVEARLAALGECVARYESLGVVVVGELGDEDLVGGLCAAHVRPSMERAPVGEVPRVSASGHPSELARLVDPADLDSRPGKRFLGGRRVWNAADVLDRAVSELCNTTLSVNPGFDVLEVG